MKYPCPLCGEPLNVGDERLYISDSEGMDHMNFHGFAVGVPANSCGICKVSCSEGIINHIHSHSEKDIALYLLGRPA